MSKIWGPEIEYQMMHWLETGQIIGHYHPKANLKLRAGKASGKCFIFDEKLMIIPAFGVSTGGLNITDKAISKLFSNTPDVYFCYKAKLYHIHDVANLLKWNRKELKKILHKFEILKG